MVASDWTLLGPLALRELFFRVFAHIISTTLLFMAWLAKMGVAPTEPLGYAAAELAFEFDEVLAVFWAILDGNVTTICTD